MGEIIPPYCRPTPCIGPQGICGAIKRLPPACSARAGPERAAAIGEADGAGGGRARSVRNCFQLQKMFSVTVLSPSCSRPRRQIVARIGFQRTAANTYAIDPAFFFLGGAAEIQASRLGPPVPPSDALGSKATSGRQSPRRVRPILPARTARASLPCPSCRRRHRPGRCIFLPGLAFAIGAPPAFPGGIPAARGGGGIAPTQRQHVEIGIEEAQLALTFAALTQPRTRVPPQATVTSPIGTFDMLAQFAREIETAGGEIARGLRRLHFPCHRRGESLERNRAWHRSTASSRTWLSVAAAISAVALAA